MNVWERVMKALQGSVAELGELFVDDQAIRILEQEVREAQDALRQSKESLAGVMAKSKVADYRCQEIQEKITEYEGYAVSALEKGDESLAMEVAEKIAAFEEELLQDQALAKGLSEDVSQLKISIKKAENDIRRIQQQLDTVQATESVHQAQAAISERTGSKVSTAMESLERIKERQAYESAKQEAVAALSDVDKDRSLEEKLKAAGIVTSGTHAQAVLNRLKNKT